MYQQQYNQQGQAQNNPQQVLYSFKSKKMRILIPKVLQLIILSSLFYFGILVNIGLLKLDAETETMIKIKLPSNKEKAFLPTCRAAIGIAAGAGRLEKPFMKAGTKFFKMRARNKLYPKVCGISMNAVDHPFGGCHSTHKGRPTLSPRSAPPGRKVGKIAPRRTGKKR